VLLLSYLVLCVCVCVCGLLTSRVVQRHLPGHSMHSPARGAGEGEASLGLLPESGRWYVTKALIATVPMPDAHA
jgi:hypothetical protein